MRLVCPGSGSRFCFGAQGLRLLHELVGAHRWVCARQFYLPIGLTFLLGVRYFEALSLTVL